ncbi:methyltransferase [Paralimibaculum aggregatum]|uniref:Methyltransferase n=1 Tax=Paralimibaculum aggregatum TaxID=3036245 RepID=A0ABQ6LFI4_9RHOB|nr:methyltransferase [Limibaculum sp. NKW23]GMG82083.1 methyltransferase [Limibaculum sp. NKW23]
MSLAAPDAALTEDHFLGGRVRLLQPKAGYRAATDPVLLAAAVPAEPGERVLDLGCGAGAATLCLAARVPGLVLAGLELQPAYLALAARNAALNGVAVALHEGDVAAPPAALRAQSFDHAIMNPPFHAPADLASPVEGRDIAHRIRTDLAAWIGCALARLRPRGRLTLIQRAERLPEILAAIGDRAGGIVVRPLAARVGRDAKRVLLTARKGSRGPFRLAAPLILHAGTAHLADREDFTAEARAILRDAAPLAL